MGFKYFKYLLCIHLLYSPQFVISSLNNVKHTIGIRSVARRHLDSVEMSGLELLDDSPEVEEGQTSLATSWDFNDGMCFDKFDIKPRTDGFPGSRTIGRMPDFGGHLVAIRCSWPIAVTGDSYVEISMKICERDWDLPCTVWNLTLDYVLDLESLQTETTVICPRDRRRSVKIPSEAKEAALTMTGLVTRTPRLSLDWTYIDEPTLSDNTTVTPEEDLSGNTWGSLAIIGIVLTVFILAGGGLTLFVLNQPRTGTTDDDQYETEPEEDYQRPLVPLVPRPPTIESERSLVVYEQRQEQQPLLPLLVRTPYSTFLLQPPPPPLPRCKSLF